MREMTPDEWTPEERKAYRRAEKRCEALQNANEGLHFWIWRRELAEPTPFDDDDPEDGPPPGWTATGLN